MVAHVFRPAFVISETSGADLEQGLSELFGNPPSLIVSSPSTVNYLVRSGTATLGFGQLVYRSEGSGCFSGFWIHGIYISPSYRRMGIGNELVRTIVSRARDLGAGEVFIQVSMANRSAVRMYERAGFRNHPGMSGEMEKHLDTLFQQTGVRSVIMSLLL
jgi:GNAT superfamily N-acetyltransferase